MSDDETWQYYLSVLTNSRVLNFGVSGYGMDQAYLKAKRKLNDGLSTPIVILAIQTIDLARSLNAYRSFLKVNTGSPLGFKPLVAKIDGEYRWMPNPLDTLTSRNDVQRAYETAKQQDFWYRNRVLRNEFPYTLDVGRLLLMFAGFATVPRFDQWENEDATKRLEITFDMFFQEVTARGFTPVIVVIPSAKDLRDRIRGTEPGSRRFFDRLRQKYADTELIIVDVLDKKAFDEKRFQTREFAGHTSAYGNRVIAERIHEELRDKLTQVRDMPVERSR